MALVGIPFALQSPRGGRVIGIALCLALGLGYFIVHSAALALARAEILPPLVAAWAANALFATLGSTSTCAPGPERGRSAAPAVSAGGPLPERLQRLLEAALGVAVGPPVPPPQRVLGPCPGFPRAADQTADALAEACRVPRADSRAAPRRPGRRPKIDWREASKVSAIAIWLP